MYGFSALPDFQGAALIAAGILGIYNFCPVRDENTFSRS